MLSGITNYFKRSNNSNSNATFSPIHSDPNRIKKEATIIIELYPYALNPRYYSDISVKTDYNSDGEIDSFNRVHALLSVLKGLYTEEYEPIKYKYKYTTNVPKSGTIDPKTAGVLATYQYNP
jgi:hypothetical protein